MNEKIKALLGEMEDEAIQSWGFEDPRTLEMFIKTEKIRKELGLWD